jgi:Glycosyl hydrolases family 38 N-terminal domain
MGFDAFFFARLDYQDKEKRLAEQTMEWVWRPMHDTLGNSVQILTHAFYNMYWTPDDFDFDTLSGDAPFIDDESLDTYNAPKLAAELHDWILHEATHYRANDIIIMMGADFHF